MTMFAKGVMLLLALVGYMLAYKKSRLPMPFCCSVIASGVTLALYLAGFAGMLRPAAYLVAGAGVLLFLRWARPRSIWRLLSEPSLWFCVLAGVWLFAITRGVTLSHADDGSHWYRMNKALFYEGAFPTTPDITYYDYVPGIQVWNAFIQRFIGFSIPNCLFAQGLLSVFFMSSLFAGGGGLTSLKERFAAGAAICAGAVTLCCMTVGTYTLTVDLQLGCVFMAALIWMMHQGGQARTRLPMMLILGFMVLIKRSGLFFALMVVVWALIRYRWRGWKLSRTLFCWLVVPVALYLMYIVRTELVYGGMADSLQGVSIDRYERLMAQKNGDVLVNITKAFLYALFVEGDKSSLPMTVYALCGVMIALYLLFRRCGYSVQAFRTRRALVHILVLLGIYCALLYLTYLLSMTVDEALRMSSFSRYYGTVVLGAFGLALYLMLYLITSVTGGALRSKRAAVFLLLAAALVFVPGAYPKTYILGYDAYQPPQQYHDSLWKNIEYFVPQRNTYSEDRYLVVWNPSELSGIKKNEKRVKNAVTSWVRSMNVDTITAKKINLNTDPKTLEAMRSYDYIVFLTDMTRRSKYMTPYLPITDYTAGTRKMPAE